MRRLVVLPVSPWSERAKWALDHHRLAYERIEHVPFLGERKLRRLVGAKKERATVPVLIDNNKVLRDSWDIALYADRHGSGSKLIPDEHRAEIERWNALAEETMSTGRAVIVASTLAHPRALDESLALVPPALRPLLRPISRYGTRWFAKKYGLRLDDLDAPIAKMRSALETLRAAIAESKTPLYLTGAFSYADIVMAISLQGIEPVADRYWPIGHGTREAWTQAELAEEFRDLLAWRDRLYAEHRASQSQSQSQSTGLPLQMPS